jgi:hypothetical protein
MGRLIISETERQNILSLYEEENDEHKKENEFLKKYVGKTFISYIDADYQTLPWKMEIKDIIYRYNSIEINPNDVKNHFSFHCLYNPNRIGYKGWVGSLYRYNKTLIDDINQKGTAAGIKWCQKPKADFGIKSINESSSSTPPPDESRILINKNPFKYPDYEKARQVYSSKLKDGDVFYTTNDNFIPYMKKIFTEFYNDYLGKTIRDNENDKIVTIKQYTKGYNSPWVEYFHNKYDPIQVGTVEMIYYMGNSIANIKFSKGNNGSETLGGYTSVSNPFPERDKVLNIIKENLKKYYNTVFQDLSQFPDNVFDINLVQRQKTDF